MRLRTLSTIIQQIKIASWAAKAARKRSTQSATPAGRDAREFDEPRSFCGCPQIRILGLAFSDCARSQSWPSWALAAFRSRAESASNLYKHGQAAEAREDYDAAFDNYQKADAKAPKDLRYRTALVRVRVSASGLHMTKGRKLLAGGRRAGRAGRVPPCRGDRSRQRGRAAGDCPGSQARKDQAPAGRAQSPRRCAGKQQEIDSMGSPVMLQAGLQRAAHAAHGRGRQGRLPGRRQGRRHQCALRSRLQLQAHPGGPDQRFAARCAAHRRAPCPTPSGARSPPTPSLSPRTPAPSAPSSMSRRCRPST